ncbi:MAG: CDP-alcohol phosphatidyltransferase family protein [Thermoprotei archaeon]|nr:MAG: CDP-alcohol phosphatidyltransferase family protein [Thermoprotei archaeon]
MLTRLRESFNRIIVPLASFLAKIGIRANTVTTLALVTALIYPISILVLPPTYHIHLTLLILISGILDSIDGVIARITSEESKLGAFLDSTMDRVSDIAYMFGLLISRIATPIEALLLLSGSMLISYIRAKYESLTSGGSLEGVGICERAERTLLIFIIALVYYLNYILSKVLLCLLLVLVWITVAQRFLFVLEKLRKFSSKLEIKSRE